jgi:cytoskeleton protein RodZ
MAEEEYAAPDTAAEGAADTELPESVESVAASDAISTPAPAVVPDPAAPDPVAPDPVTIETAAAMPAPIKQIVLYFAASTWADVRDAESQLLLAQTVTRGQVVALQGTPPFAVNIGQAAGVQVGYEGKRYNVKPRNADASARFSVGKFDLP